MMTEPRPRTYRLTEEQIEAMLETAAEKGAAKGTKEILRHFGVFDEKGAHVLIIQWQKISGWVDLYDKAALSMGHGILWLLGAGLALLAGAIAGIKLGLFGGGNG